MKAYYHINSDTLRERRLDNVTSDDTNAGLLIQKPHTYRYFERSWVARPRVEVLGVGYDGIGQVYTSYPENYPGGNYVQAATSPISDPDWVALQERCQEKIWNQVRGNSELLIDLAEAKQTKAMLVAAVNTAVNFKRHFLKDVLKLAEKYAPKRGYTLGYSARRARDKSLENLRDKWLEARYGWIPLSASLYEAGETLRKRVWEREFIISAKAGKTDIVSQQFRTANSLRVDSAEFLHLCHTGYWFKPLPPSVQSLTNWTSLNPLSIAWELVPLSFVADWFSNVGDQLRSWENHSIYQSSFLKGFETKLVREVRHGSYYFNDRVPIRYWPDGSAQAGVYGSIESWASLGKYVDKNRRILTSLPYPVGFRLKCDLNSKRIVDALALSYGPLRRLYS